MFKLNSPPLRVLLGLVVLTLLTTPALVAETPHLAATQLGGTVVTWQPQVEYEQLTLRVVGPAGTFTRVFEEGEIPFFDLSTLEGSVDGPYTFELTASPRLSPEVRQTLQAARERGEDLGLERRLRTEGLLPAEPLVQSGYLKVVGGQFVSPDRDEPTMGALQPRTAGGDGVSSTAGDSSVRNISAADQVILDDLIVDGSLCVGFDCVNGESFGFDTIRLKENNVRIKFQDTSSSASFPSNDWQLTANDSANGGANKFSIDDIDGGRTPFTIEAATPSNSLYVDSSGQIGFGTSTPVVELHVADGDTPTLRLEQNGSSGFTPQTWDVAGNETNFFVRDVTNGSRLPFRIRPSAPDSSIDIAADGDVGIGTSSPGTFSNSGDDAAVHIFRDATDEGGLLIERTALGSDVLLELRANGTPRIDMIDTNSNTEWRFEASGSGFNINDLADSGSAEFTVQTDGDVVIEGTLTVGPGGCTNCDLVFQDPETLVESIEQHAEYMWANSHLPGVGPTPEDAPMNLSKKTGGILNELEKAHIYIEQLHNRLANRENEVDELKDRLAKLESLLLSAQ